MKARSRCYLWLGCSPPPHYGRVVADCPCHFVVWGNWLSSCCHLRRPVLIRHWQTYLKHKILLIMQSFFPMITKVISNSAVTISYLISFKFTTDFVLFGSGLFVEASGERSSFWQEGSTPWLCHSISRGKIKWKDCWKVCIIFPFHVL